MKTVKFNNKELKAITEYMMLQQNNAEKFEKVRDNLLKMIKKLESLRATDKTLNINKSQAVRT